MKSIYSLLALLFTISPWAAHAGVAYSTFICPQTVVVPGNSFVPPSIELAQIGGNVNSVTAPYAGGIPGGPGGYTNPSNAPMTLQLNSASCYASAPSCNYERPPNATYGGPNGPGYRTDSSTCVSCSEKPDRSLLCGRDG